MVARWHATTPAQPPAPKRYTGNNPIVWIDLETTDNDPLTAKMLEIAVVITDGDLNEVDATGLQYVIHADEKTLNTMPQKVITMHRDSGLTQECRNSQHTKASVEAAVLQYIKKYVPRSWNAHFGGSTVYFDRIMLLREMPRLAAHMKYQVLDITSIMIAAKTLYGGILPGAPQGNHRAMKDIRNTIDQYRFYRKHLFKPSNEVRLSIAAEREQAAAASSNADEAATDEEPARKRQRSD